LYDVRYFCAVTVAFKIYDIDRDGYISNGELFQVLKMMVGNNLKDGQLQQIVDKTIIYSDKDGDGRISYDEFCAVCISHRHRAYLCPCYFSEAARRWRFDLVDNVVGCTIEVNQRRAWLILGWVTVVRWVYCLDM